MSLPGHGKARNGFVGPGKLYHTEVAIAAFRGPGLGVRHPCAELRTGVRGAHSTHQGLAVGLDHG